MSDDHKVNGMTLREREMHIYLLEWLFKYGMDKVRRNRVWNDGDWRVAQECVMHGFLDTTNDSITEHYSHALTEKGLEFINGQRS